MTEEELKLINEINESLTDIKNTLKEIKKTQTTSINKKLPSKHFIIEMMSLPVFFKIISLAAIVGVAIFTPDNLEIVTLIIAGIYSGSFVKDIVHKKGIKNEV